MKIAFDCKELLKTAFAVIAALCLFSSVSTSAFALTKEELIAYFEDVKNIVEENSLQLKPGSLKTLSQEQKQKKSVEIARMLNTGDINRHDLLLYFSDIFNRNAERLFKELEIGDTELADWNRKLIAGYQDSHEVTKLALSLLKTPDMAGLKQALGNTDLQKRIRDNQEYHHGIKAELDKIIKSYFPADQEVQRLSRRLVGLYVETTWK